MVFWLTLESEDSGAATSRVFTDTGLQVTDIVVSFLASSSGSVDAGLLSEWLGWESGCLGAALCLIGKPFRIFGPDDLPFSSRSL